MIVIEVETSSRRMPSKSSPMSASESMATSVRPTFARGTRIVGVEPELCGQIEGDGEPRLAALVQVAEALVRLLRRAEPGVLLERPRLAAVHVCVGPRVNGNSFGRARSTPPTSSAV